MPPIYLVDMDGPGGDAICFRVARDVARNRAERNNSSILYQQNLAFGAIDDAERLMRRDRDIDLATAITRVLDAPPRPIAAPRPEVWPPDALSRHAEVRERFFNPLPRKPIDPQPAPPSAPAMRVDWIIESTVRA